MLLYHVKLLLLLLLLGELGQAYWHLACNKQFPIFSASLIHPVSISKTRGVMRTSDSGLGW